MKKNDKTNWSYLAGLLDGVGCFTIAGSWKPTKEGKHYLHMNLLISLYNNNLEVMHWLINHFGGTFYVHHPSEQPNHKAGYSWHPKGANNKELLILGVLPYLIIKKEQAQISLDYIRLKKQDPQARIEMRERIQTLNGHGGGKRQTTNTLVNPDDEEGLKIESDLIGDYESAPLVTMDA
jgi:hypothetical protein